MTDLISHHLAGLERQVHQADTLYRDFRTYCHHHGIPPARRLKSLQSSLKKHPVLRTAGQPLLELVQETGHMPASIRRLWQAAQPLVQQLRQQKSQVIESNQRLVCHIARKFPCTELPLIDRIQEGNLGLLRAVDRFDVQRGNRFSTYAIHWIRYAISNTVIRRSTTISLPVHRARKLQQLMYLRHQSYALHGHPAGINTLSDTTGLPSKDVRRLLYLSRPAISMDSPIKADSISPHEFLPADKTPDPAAELDQAQLAGLTGTLLEGLPAKQALVIRLRFGIGVYQPYTLEAISRQFGVTRERIRQIETTALQTLRELSSSRLDAFLDHPGPG